MRHAPLLAAAATASALGGCALLSTPDPEQLYRFSAPTVAAPPAAAASAPVRLGVDAVTFPREAGGVRILTTEGPRVSYLGGARWAAPAPILFETALIDAFASAGDVTLYRRGAGPAVQGLLRVEVTAFEAAYDQGPEAPPLVTVRLSARLMRRADLSVVGERQVTSTRRAAFNSVGEVVTAFEGATADALADTSGWALATARGGAFAAR